MGNDLAALTKNLLLPAIVFVVHFSYLDCGESVAECEEFDDEAALLQAEKEAKLAQIYYQLDLAFRPMGVDSRFAAGYQNLLRGHIVRLGPRYARPLPPS